MHAFVTRSAAAADVAEMQSIAEQTGLFPPEMLPDMIAPMLAGESDDLWHLALLDTDIVGFAYTVPEPMTDGAWNMRAIAVTPVWQGQGAGRTLVLAVEETLRRLNQRLLIVDTSGVEAFENTRRFYAALGYQQEARIRNFWEAGDDKVTFAKTL